MQATRPSSTASAASRLSPARCGGHVLATDFQICFSNVKFTATFTTQSNY